MKRYSILFECLLYSYLPICDLRFSARKTFIIVTKFHLLRIKAISSEVHEVATKRGHPSNSFVTQTSNSKQLSNWRQEVLKTSTFGWWEIQKVNEREINLIRFTMYEMSESSSKRRFLSKRSLLLANSKSSWDKKKLLPVTCPEKLLRGKQHGLTFVTCQVFCIVR